ncbi:MAG TPA: hypothetical protein VGD08_19235, partial [Stellaceae bacterium]
MPEFRGIATLGAVTTAPGTTGRTGGVAAAADGPGGTAGGGAGCLSEDEEQAASPAAASSASAAVGDGNEAEAFRIEAGTAEK